MIFENSVTFGEHLIRVLTYDLLHLGDPHESFQDHPEADESQSSTDGHRYSSREKIGTKSKDDRSYFNGVAVDIGQVDIFEEETFIFVEEANAQQTIQAHQSMHLTHV